VSTVATASPGQHRRASLGVALLACALAVLIAGCTKHEDEVRNTRLFTLGTLVDVTLWKVDEARAAKAVQAVEARLNEIHHTWHAWQPSALTKLNQAMAQGGPVPVTPQERELLLQARKLARESGELFNPAIGRLIGLWGFHSDERPAGPPPPQADIDKLVAAAPSMEQMEFTDDHVVSHNPVLELDFGGFAKGYAVNQAIEVLRGMGIDNAIVNAGGDLRAIGSHGGRPWRIGIRHPAGSGVIAALETHGDESVFTSGNYERYFEYNGVRYHHILDPRTGYPARGSLSVTVVCDDAATADAAATALFVAGPEGWREVARNMGIKEVMLIDENMTVYMTPAMAARIQFTVEPKPKTVVTPL